MNDIYKEENDIGFITNCLLSLTIRISFYSLWKSSILSRNDQPQDFVKTKIYDNNNAIYKDK